MWRNIKRKDLEGGGERREKRKKNILQQFQGHSSPDFGEKKKKKRKVFLFGIFASFTPLPASSSPTSSILLNSPTPPFSWTPAPLRSPYYSAEWKKTRTINSVRNSDHSLNTNKVLQQSSSSESFLLLLLYQLAQIRLSSSSTLSPQSQLSVAESVLHPLRKEPGFFFFYFQVFSLRKVKKRKKRNDVKILKNFNAYCQISVALISCSL